jgi:hypothetical protein
MLDGGGLRREAFRQGALEPSARCVRVQAKWPHFKTVDHIGQVSTAIFHVMAFLIGGGIVALLVTLFVVGSPLG